MNKMKLSLVPMTILLLASITAMAIPVVMVSATPIDVPGDYPTIQEAIDATDPGETIIVHAGTYPENIVIDKALTLKGEDRETTTIQSVLEGGMWGTYGDRVVIIESSQVSISGFTFSGYTSTEGKRGSTSWCVYAHGDYTDILVSDNIFTFYGQGGIRFYDVSDSKISNNLFQSETRSIWYDPPGVEPGSYVDRTLGGAGPELWGGSGISVKGNTMETSSIGIFIMGSSEVSIKKNTISAKGLADSGIHMQSGTSISVIGNEITGFKNGPKKGYIHGMKGTGIHVYSSDNIDITRNDIRENAVGIYVATVNTMDSPANVGIHANNIEDNDDYGVCNFRFPPRLRDPDTGKNLDYWDYEKFDEANAVVNARANWWGHTTGPEHTLNPDGEGNKVSDNVDFKPWHKKAMP